MAGRILSPLLATIALSVLHEHFTAKWEALGPDWTRANMHTLVRRSLPGWQVRVGKIELFRPESAAIVRYSYRGTHPWRGLQTRTDTPSPAAAQGDQLSAEK